MGKDGANYKKDVDKLVKELLQCKSVDEWDAMRSLNQSYKRLESTSRAEREFMRDVVGTNLILSRAVGQLAVIVNNLSGELDALKAKIK